MDTLTNLTDALNARQNEYRYPVLDPLKGGELGSSARRHAQE